MNDSARGNAHPDVFQELIRLRDRQRAELASAPLVIRGSEVPFQVSGLGRIQWLLHPFAESSAIRSLVVAVHELEPGEASGKLHHQGGTVIYFIAGRGKTTVNEQVYEWEADDLINTPILPHGVTVQHTNTGESPARYLEATPNHIDSLSVDRGSGFELIEPFNDAGAQKEAG